VACAAWLLGSALTRPAPACSIAAPPPALIGYPSDGDVEVPTDVVPFYESPSVYLDLETAEFTLTSSTGELIAAQAAATQEYTVDLTPQKALQPHTTYTLVANLHAATGPERVESLTLDFTTGAGPVSTLPAPPQLSLLHYQFDPPPLSSCSPAAQGTCVLLTAGLPVEETYLDEAGREGQFVYLPQPTRPRRMGATRTPSAPRPTPRNPLRRQNPRKTQRPRPIHRRIRLQHRHPNPPRRTLAPNLHRPRHPQRLDPTPANTPRRVLTGLACDPAHAPQCFVCVDRGGEGGDRDPATHLTARRVLAPSHRHHKTRASLS
jgi:hypothetical protein